MSRPDVRPPCDHDVCRGGPTCILPHLKDPFAGLFTRRQQVGQQYQIPITLDPSKSAWMPGPPAPPVDPNCIADIDCTSASARYGLGAPPVSAFFGRGVRIEVWRGAFGDITRVRVYKDGPDDQDQAGTKAQFEGPPPWQGGRYAQCGYVHLPDVPVPPVPGGVPSLDAIDPDTVKPDSLPIDIQTFRRLVAEYKKYADRGVL